MTIWMTPYLLLGPLMLWDEFYFHRKRGLKRWEAIGHPLDTMTVALPLSLAAFAPFAPPFLLTYAVLALFSCVFVTKDETVHKQESPAPEQHLHALLFILHPLLFIAGYALWQHGTAGDVAALRFLRSQVLIVLAFGAYQVVAWRHAWKK